MHSTLSEFKYSWFGWAGLPQHCNVTDGSLRNRVYSSPTGGQKPINYKIFFDVERCVERKFGAADVECKL
ncbi:hypothetical protein TIFTF001_022366 [Ficus carica]|uniref:Uncharacterized protein n=1 Tax=Ficus carica TaxID=3494 RepID=A0AA88AVR4_FICCA|nr:hypothetical protein TIFTF001_022366 [Ficus carica]